MKMTEKTRNLLIVIVLVTVPALFIILNLSRFTDFLSYAAFVLRPVLIGFVLAYLANPLFRLFERKLFFNVNPHGLRRFLALLFTYIVFFLILVALVLLIVPQLVESVMDFLTSYESYLYNAITNINTLVGNINQMFSVSIPYLNYTYIQEAIGNFFINLQIQSFFESLLTYSNISTLFNTLGTMFFLVADIFFGIFISIYILASKEKQYAQIMRVRAAMLNPKINGHLTNICTIADRSFGGFLRGKILDSSIVGLLVFVLIWLLDIPYALLIAVIVGITDIVPVIGPFVGVIPSAIIILLTDPIKVIPFLLCILVVQQIDGNIIAPKILGENTGVSSLCVMIAITLMGAIAGFVGMIIAVPLFATIIELFGGFLNRKLRQKGLAQETAEAPKESDKKTRKEKKKSARPSLHVGGGGDLCDEERARLRAYTLACKHGVLNEQEPSDAFLFFASEYTGRPVSSEGNAASADAEADD